MCLDISAKTSVQRAGCSGPAQRWGVGLRAACSSFTLSFDPAVSAAPRHAHYRRSRFAAARAHLWRARRNYFKLPPLRKEIKKKQISSERYSSWYSRKSPSTRARAQSSLRIKQHAKIITEDNVLSYIWGNQKSVFGGITPICNHIAVHLYL